jgi:hypothetical protein
VTDARAPQLDVDAHGRIAAADEGARRALADRAGRFALLPSAPDLLVACRTPAAGGAAPRPRCVLAGDLSAFSIADFVAFVHGSKLSGALVVSAGGAERRVSFRDGEVRGAASDAPGERLGEVAVRLGFLGEDALAAALASGRPLGKVLVERGHLTPSDLWRCLHEQVAAVFHAILLSREGVFALLDCEEEGGTTLSVNTQSLLMDGIRRIDEMSLFRARIPGPGALLRRREPRTAVTLTPAEGALLELVDGRRSLAEVARAAHQGEFDATKTLYHLAEAGYVEVAPQAAPAERFGSDEEGLSALAGAMNAILRTIAAAVAETSALDPFLTGVRTFLADPAGRHAPLWRGLAPGRDGGVDAGVLARSAAALDPEVLAGFGPGAGPRQALGEALRELVFFYLFQAGERLPRDADERLSREVKRRFAALEALP